MSALQVEAIYLYPVKSTAAWPVPRAQVSPRGLAHDRRWMVVAPDGRFLTGRELPALTRFRARVRGKRLELTGPDGDTLTVDAADEAATGAPVRIWDDACTGVPASPAADAWLATRLGRPCRLVQMTEACPRPVDAAYGLPGDEVSFADGYPLLLIGAGSLADLEQRRGEAVSMLRFRPNVVVSGSPAFAEDGWRSLRIGDVLFDGVKACARCVFTTVDPDTGERDPRQEPLRTLSSYRRRPEGGVYFGQNLIPRAGGTICVGDPVTVLD